jgi:hypothetical protein
MIRVRQKSSLTGDTWRVDFILASAAFSGIEMVGTPPVYRDIYESLSRAEPFKNTVTASRCEVTLLVRNQAERNAVQALMYSNEGDYTVQVFRNDSFHKQYTLLPDLCTMDEGPYPYRARLVGKDTTSLESVSYDLHDDTVTIAQALSDAGLSKIIAHTSWYHQQGGIADDFLGNTTIDRYQLRRLSTRDEQPDEPLSCLEVIQAIAKSFKLFIKQHSGAWYVTQKSAYIDPLQVTQAVYENGVRLSQSVVNAVQLMGGDTHRVTVGSSAEQIPAYQKILSTFDHRQKEQGIVFPSFFNIVALASRDFEQFYSTGGGTDTINVSGLAIARPDQPVSNSQVLVRPEVRIVLQVGNRYWNNALGIWQSLSVVNTFEMVPMLQSESAVNPGGDIGGGTDIGEGTVDYYFSRVSINTSLIPQTGTQQDQFIKITFLASDNFAGRTVISEFRDFEYNLDSTSPAARSRAIVYGSEQNRRGVDYDDGGRLFGDGPTDFATSAIRDNNGDAVSQWYRRGVMTSPVTHAKLLHDEIMGVHTSSLPLITAEIKPGYYDLSKVMGYRNQVWSFISGQMDAYTGEQQYAFVRNAWALPDQSLAVSFTRPGSFVQSALLSAVRLSQVDSWDTEGSFVYRLRLGVLSGATVSALSVDGEDLAQEGQVLRLVNPITLVSQEFTVQQDQQQGSSFIVVEPVAAQSSYPVGSYVFLSEKSVQAGLLAGREALRAFSESRSIGVLTNDVAGYRETLPVQLNVPVRGGQDLEIVTPLGARFEITPAQDYGVGVHDMDIRDLDGLGTPVTAPAGSSISPDTVYTQSEQLWSAGEVAINVASEREAESVSRVRLSLPTNAAVTSLPVQNARTIKLLDGQKIVTIPRPNPFGSTKREAVEFTVNGEQEITAASTGITVHSKTPEHPVSIGDTVQQPAYDLTGSISVQAGQINAVAQSVGSLGDSVASLQLAVGAVDQELESVRGGGRFAVTNELVGFAGTQAVTRAYLSGDQGNNVTTGLLIQFDVDYNLKTGDLITVVSAADNSLHDFEVAQDYNGSAETVTIQITSVDLTGTVLPTGSRVLFKNGLRSQLSIWPVLSVNLLASQPVIIGDSNATTSAAYTMVAATAFTMVFASPVEFVYTPVGAMVFEPAYIFTERISTIGAKTTLIADSEGNIASMSLLATGEGTAFSVKADQLNFEGQATFTQKLLKLFSSNSFVITAIDAPLERAPDVDLVIGDVWLDSSTVDLLPHTWDGTSWIRGFTRITGGILETGSVKADKLDVSDLFSQEITIETGGFIQSAGYSDTAEQKTGFKIFANGNADFFNARVRGTLEAEDGYLKDLDVTGQLSLTGVDAKLVALTNVNTYVAYTAAGLEGKQDGVQTFFLPNDASTKPVIKGFAVDNIRIAPRAGNADPEVPATADQFAFMSKQFSSSDEVEAFDMGASGLFLLLKAFKNFTTSEATGSLACTGLMDLFGEMIIRPAENWLERTVGLGAGDASGVYINRRLRVSGAFVELTNLPTADTDLAVGRVWRDGNTLKIKT